MSAGSAPDAGRAAIEAAIRDLGGPDGPGAPPPPDLAARRGHLEALARAVRRAGDEIAAAISEDFGHRPRPETLLTEVAMVLEAVRHARRNLRCWTRTRRVVLPPHLWPSRAEIRREPLGLVGLHAPWNYPVQLALVPLVAALAGGNRVILHPSEGTPRTADLLARLLHDALPGRVRVVTGGAEIARALAETPLGLMFFTGSTATGRRVMEACAHTLTPVVLELGGKSPAILRADADLDAAAASVAAGKLLNAGQTCVAPDYVLVPRARMEAFEAALARAAATLYPDPEGPDYATLAAAGDRARLEAMLEGAEARPLMDPMPAAPRMGFWAVIDPPGGHPSMTGEIFGPVLPLIPYDTPEEARAFVAARPVPLALYVYGADEAAALGDVAALRSGGAMVNEAVQHVGVMSLPFGGQGDSGLGAYHGEEGFRAFTRPRSVVVARRSAARLVRPPYGRTIERVLGLLMR